MTRNFDILIEVTQNTGARQWHKEFGPCLRHMTEYATRTRKPLDKIFLILVVKKIHADTYNSLRQKITEGLNVLPLTFKNIETITEVCHMTIGIRHVDIKNLFDRLARKIEDISNLKAYQKTSDQIICDWRKEYLSQNKLLFIAIKGYKLLKSKKDGTALLASYIASELYTQKDVKAYFNIIGQPPNRTDVRNGLLNFGFAYESGVHTGDPFLSIANKNEIEPILKEIMKHLNEI